MGLIRAGVGALGGVMADQWKEFFYCESLPADVLITKGAKRVGGRSSNTKGSDNIISNGSGIAVADGQCALIVEQGKVVEFCAEPGEYTYDISTEPSLFSGKLGESIKQTFATIGKRFTYGGDTGKDQRVYYINTKEIIGNKFGTQTPILFKVLIPEANFSLNTKVRCSGVYSYKITDPITFYTRVAGNVTEEYRRDEIDEQLKSEMIDALQPAFGELSALRLDPSEIPAHKNDLKMALNNALAYEWTQRRGIAVESIAIANLSIPEEDEAKIQRAQTALLYSNPAMAAGMISEGTLGVAGTAAANEAGAMNGFIGMGMGMNAMGGSPMNNVGDLLAMNQQQQQQTQQTPPAPQAPQGDSWVCSCGNTASGKFCTNCGSPKPQPKPQGDSWVCSCGNTTTGKFCTNCGSPKPQAPEGWTCQCGAVNQGKFCPNCGSPKPVGAPLYKCDKCGWTPEDPHNPPKFCPNCGDIFDENDRS